MHCLDILDTRINKIVLLLLLFTLVSSLYSYYGVISFVIISFVNGDKQIRTADPLLARQVLSQLSYTPM